MDKNKILKSLKADMKHAENSRQEQDAKIEEWKNAYDGAPYKNEQKGKSAIVSRDVKKQDEWIHPSILEPFTDTQDIVNVTPITWEDKAKATQTQLLLNYQFCRQFKRFSFMTKALKVLSKEGTLVVQTGWEYRDKKVTRMAETIEVDESGIESIVEVEMEETEIVKNQPTAVVCRNEDVFVDPTCMDDMDKCQFVIHRYETDYSTLKQDGRYKNLDKVMKSALSDSHTDFDFDTEDESEFRFQDDPRKKLLMHEYWGNYDIDGSGIAKPIVCAWIGDVIVMLRDNPYPDKAIPFIIVPYNSVPFQMSGESDAELIGDNQKIKTAVTRGIIDNMAQSNNGQTGVKKGALDAANRKKFLSDDNFEFNGTPNDFWFGSYNSIPSSAFDMLTVQSNEIESQTGAKSFSGGISGGAISGSATGVRGALSATATRRMYRVRNIAENLIEPLMRKWLSYNTQFMSDTEIVDLTNDTFVPITKGSFTGEVDLEIEVSTAEDNQAKAQELSFMMQTTAQSMDPDMQFDLMADWATLTKMPEAAKRLRDKAEKVRQQMDQPDPVKQKMQEIEIRKLELANKKTEAEIYAIYAAGKEDESDKMLKSEKARLEGAKADKMISEKDLLDISYIKEDEQIGHQESMETMSVAHRQDMQKEYLKYKANIDQMKFQAKNDDTNLGVIQ